MTRWILALFLFSTLVPVWAGTVEGEVTVKSVNKVERNPRGGRGGRYQERAKSKSGPETENVIVSFPELTSPKRSPKTASVGQVGKEFSPHVTAIRVGDNVEFPNGDKVYHSVYSQSPTREFQLPEYPKGESRTEKNFAKAGHIEVFCAIHSHMNAHIVVFENDFFVKPDSKGKFRIEGLPPGKHQIRAWHPKLGAQTQLVEVPKEGVVKVNFSLK